VDGASPEAVSGAVPFAVAGASADGADSTGALAGGAPPDQWIRWLAVGGIALTAVNMFGGFAVTQRMLDMFRK